MEKPAEGRSPATTSNTPVTAAPDVLAVAVFQPRRVSFPRRALVLYLIWGLLIVLIGAEVGYLVTYFQPAKYGARSEIYFQLDNSLPSGFLREDRALSTQLVDDHEPPGAAPRVAEIQRQREDSWPRRCTPPSSRTAR